MILCSSIFAFVLDILIWTTIILFYYFQVDIPRAFVCAESKIFDVSEWATCQVKFYIKASSIAEVGRIFHQLR